MSLTSLDLSMSPQSSPSDSDRHPATGSDWRRGMQAGYTLLASVLLGLGLGYAVDVWLETTPVCTVGGALLFIVAGLYQVVKEYS